MLCAFRHTRTSADPFRLLCIRLSLLLVLPLPLRLGPSARFTVGGTPCALWFVGDFLCDCMFREKSGWGLTTQPVGTATMTTVTSTNRVDLESFRSRCWTIRRTHTSADAVRVLCTRLTLPLTLSLPSRLAPSARLTVDVPTQALWLAGVFIRRKTICAGVVGTRTDWELKGEEGGITTPLHQHYDVRFDGGGEILGLEGEVTRRVGHGAPCLSDSRLHLLRQAAKNQLHPCVGRGQARPPFPAFSSTSFSLGRAL